MINENYRVDLIRNTHSDVLKFSNENDESEFETLILLEQNIVSVVCWFHLDVTRMMVHECEILLLPRSILRYLLRL